MEEIGEEVGEDCCAKDSRSNVVLKRTAVEKGGQAHVPVDIRRFSRGGAQSQEEQLDFRDDPREDVVGIGN